MADLTSSNVRIIDAWTEGGVHGKKFKGMRVELHGCTVGSLTNKIVPGAFGWTKFVNCSPAYNNDGGGCVVAAPIQDGQYIGLFQTLDGATGPADSTLSATPAGFYITVIGY